MKMGAEFFDQFGAKSRVILHGAIDTMFDQLGDVISNESFLALVEIPVDVSKRRKIEDDRPYLASASAPSLLSSSMFSNYSERHAGGAP
jgi:hypothetical protein